LQPGVLQPPGQPAALNIDEVLARLTGIVDAARAGASPLGFFAALYRHVTLHVQQGIGAGFFADGPRMATLDTTFANRYLAAYDAFSAGEPASSCWQLAFTASRENRLIILQNLLLGINAHINFDLGIAAAQVCPGDAIAGLQGDFDKINQILSGLLPAVEATIGRFSPLIGLLDQLGGRSEEEVLNFSLDAARISAWNHALVLAHLPQAVWPAALDAFDQKATFLGKLVADPGGLAAKAVEMIRLTESLDVRAVIDALDALPEGAATAAVSGTAATAATVATSATVAMSGTVATSGTAAVPSTSG
jgi:hypothetical protein